MKGRDQGLGEGRVPDQLLDPFGHLAGCLVGERNRKNRIRRYPGALDEVRDAVGDDARFAAAGSGQDQHRPFDGLNRLALLWVQFVEKMLQRKSPIPDRP